jgi:ABC-2 type transport system ATP-binding protein
MLDPTPNAPLLEAVDLTKRYEDGLLAVDAVSFAVLPGEIYAMLGGNGAGKSTTIHCFLDLIRPTAGETRIAGVSVQREPLRAKRQVAYVAENVELYGDLTALQNLEFFARLGGLAPSRDELVAALLRVGLQEEAHRRRLKTFSKGMRQKTGLAVAILAGAPALILDEPTSGLDPRAAWELGQLLLALRAEGRAILMSTHDVFRAKQLADRVGIMSRGRLVLERTARELASEDLEALYLRYVAAPGGSAAAAAEVGVPPDTDTGADARQVTALAEPAGRPLDPATAFGAARGTSHQTTGQVQP